MLSQGKFCRTCILIVIYLFGSIKLYAEFNKNEIFNLFSADSNIQNKIYEDLSSHAAWDFEYCNSNDLMEPCQHGFENYFLNYIKGKTYDTYCVGIRDGSVEGVEIYWICCFRNEIHVRSLGFCLEGDLLTGVIDTGPEDYAFEPFFGSTHVSRLRSAIIHRMPEKIANDLVPDSLSGINTDGPPVSTSGFVYSVIAVDSSISHHSIPGKQQYMDSLFAEIYNSLIGKIKTESEYIGNIQFYQNKYTQGQYLYLTDSLGKRLEVFCFYDSLFKIKNIYLSHVGQSLNMVANDISTICAIDSILYSFSDSIINSIFPDIRQGANDSSSIGLLKTLFTEDSSRHKYLLLNPDLIELHVTGTAAPFEHSIPFVEWINKVEIVDTSKWSVEYREETRSDDVEFEVLTITDKESPWKQRTIWIYRMNNTVISIWDSYLN